MRPECRTLMLASVAFAEVQWPLVFARRVNLIMMADSREQHDFELQSALRAARENENRWLEMHDEYATDSETMEQWANTAKLRWLEVERIEALLAEAEGP